MECVCWSRANTDRTLQTTWCGTEVGDGIWECVRLGYGDLTCWYHFTHQFNSSSIEKYYRSSIHYHHLSSTCMTLYAGISQFTNISSNVFAAYFAWQSKRIIIMIQLGIYKKQITKWGCICPSHTDVFSTLPGAKKINDEPSRKKCVNLVALPNDQESLPPKTMARTSSTTIDTWMRFILPYFTNSISVSFITWIHIIYYANYPTICYHMWLICICIII